MNKIKVLLAACNGEPWIIKQLQSILLQSSVFVDITVSVDESNDNTKSIVESIHSEKIHLISQRDKYSNAALNFFRLIYSEDFLEFEYIAFSDQDDIWHPDKLYRAVQILTASNCDGYSSNVTAFWPDGRQKLIDKAQPQVEWDYLFESAGPGCTFVVTQKLALELQNFVRENTEKLSAIWMHDWFIYAFARSRGYKWYIDEYPSMLYRQHSNNQVGVNLGYKAFRQRIRLLRTGKWMEQSSLIASLCGLSCQPFVKKWHDHSRFGMLYLAFNAKKCRRKYSEKYFFALSCLILFFIGYKKK